MADILDSIQAPEIKRRRFTSEEVQQLLEIGLLREEDPIELIGGELVEMAPQGEAHWSATQMLVEWFFRRLPPSTTLASQGPLRLGRHDEPEPEIFIFPRRLRVNQVRGPDVLLAIEIAVSSLRFDLTIKRDLYAREGVARYWVVDLANRRTFVFSLADGAYGEPAVVGFDTEMPTIEGLAPLILGEALA